jgi:hypothetical protein
MLSKKHTAEGPLAGYLFQIDRALYLLCTEKYGNVISIELIDDVAVTDENNVIILREQDKNSIVQSNFAFKDRSKDLWQTLHIWIKDTLSGNIDLTKVRLVCATNKTCKTDSILKKISAITSKETLNNEDIDKIIELLQKASENPPAHIKDICIYVMNNQATLRKLIPRIILSESNSKENFNEKVIQTLKLPPKNGILIIESLRGWLDNMITTKLEKGLPIKISVNNFMEKFWEVQGKYENTRINILTKKAVLPTLGKNQLSDESTFIKQLEIMKHRDIEEIISEAVEDFLYHKSECTRLSDDGDITKEDIKTMEADNIDRWKQVYRRNTLEVEENSSEDFLAKLAYKIYDGTRRDYLSNICGYPVNIDFTRGCFHNLANNLEIGWHPNWKNLFIKNGENN